MSLPSADNSSSAQSVFLPVFASLPLQSSGKAIDRARAAKITRAVVWLHGLAGDANTYFCDGVSHVAEAGGTTLSESTLSIAPWFGKTQVSGGVDGRWVSRSGGVERRGEEREGAGGSVSAYWSTSRWLEGGNNSPDPARCVEERWEVWFYVVLYCVHVSVRVVRVCACVFLTVYLFVLFCAIVVVPRCIVVCGVCVCRGA